jgi:hypothetical protein
MAEHKFETIVQPPGKDLPSTLKPARPAVSGKALPLPSRIRTWQVPAEPFEGGAGPEPTARPRK